MKSSFSDVKQGKEDEPLDDLSKLFWKEGRFLRQIFVKVTEESEANIW